MPVVVLGIIGYLLYSLYLVLVDYWPFALAGVFCIWAVFRSKRFIAKKWQEYHKRLQDHKINEASQSDIFDRFSGKEIKLLPFHGSYFLMMVIGFVVAYYCVLECYTFARHEALGYAPSLRECAKHHVRSPYDLFMAVHGLSMRKSDTAYYKNVRLRDAITYLEKYFPHDDTDENFRRKYWNYARHIFRLLDFREDPLIEDSMFAQPYPESEIFKEQEARERLKMDRNKYQNEPQDVWSKQVDMITLNDALELVGMTNVPPVKVLHKLHMAILEDHKDDPKKEKLTAKAFEILGAQAVKNEMS